MVQDDLAHIEYVMRGVGRFSPCFVSYKGEFYPIRKDIDHITDAEGRLIVEFSEDKYIDPLTVFEFQKILQFYKRDIKELLFESTAGERESLVCAFVSDNGLITDSLVLAIGDGDVPMSEIGRF